MAEVSFAGEAGRLEGHYHLSASRMSPTVILMHPHPKHGGNLNSKLNYVMYKVFADHGFNVLRFNYRGVGKSDGKYLGAPNAEEEINDATTALDWVQSHNTQSNRFWVAGFSFGSWIALQILMRRPEIEGFVAICPPANLYDFSFLLPCAFTGQVIQASNDEIIDTAYVDLLVARLKTNKDITIDYQKIHTNDHFLRNHTDEVTKHISNFLTSYASMSSVA